MTDRATEPTDEDIALGIVTDFFSTMSSQGACLSDRIESALRSVRLAERERCAKRAETCLDIKNPDQRYGDGIEDAQTLIAAAIRETDSDAK